MLSKRKSIKVRRLARVVTTALMATEMAARGMRKERFIQPYHFYGANRDALKSEARQLMLHGPAETGKTIATLYKAHILAWNNKGVQGAFIRKFRSDMNGSVIQSFEQKILPVPPSDPRSKVRAFGGKNPERYIYPNGSQIWIGGIDRPGGALSAERDFVYVNQAEQLNLDDWQTLVTRTTGRAGVFQPGLLFGDCNPGPRSHWIKQLAENGVIEFIQSQHENNPNLYEQLPGGKVGELTEQGKLTMNALETLTGVTRDRLLGGEWTSAEGVVYDTWNQQTHVLSKQALLNLGIISPSTSHPLLLNRDVVRHVVAGVDWGFTNPGSIFVAAIDGDGRMYMIAEVYKVRELIDFWVKQARTLRDQFGIEKFLCDPSNPAYITKFQKAGLPAVGANNEIEAGIDRLKERMVIQADGRARFYVYEGALTERDPVLERERKRPIGFREEVEVYAYPQEQTEKSIKEIPLDQHNHSCDSARYIANALETSIQSRWRGGKGV